MPKIEKLDASNILEIKNIIEILKGKPKLLSVLKLLIINTNKVLNDKQLDKEIESMEVEEEEEEDIDLSDHSSDSDE